ncbi:hypothetical protein [Sulfoacidibacillus thermotolerans]|uniref:Uncharacterized protein n=1 Tax=Sulfoacidibacillus thermotolerans TaxID=1765684 RepID=A0A2U3D621_SULT2|nr:hypothetical protein [Sulfoacidibacillus thermotolerans]PWI56726.1 hypothetical protein BM613_12175 [Sulfoacidibacillus thermotolerans]
MPIPITWRVSQQGIVTAVSHACEKYFYSIDRPGMNDRPPSESLDDKIMGFVAEAAVIEYLKSQNISYVSYDDIRTDDFQNPDPWDIAIGKSTDVTTWRFLKTPPSSMTTVSIKSSRLVQGENLAKAVKHRDFKIFKKTSTIANDISTDLELQVYYEYDRTQLGSLEITEDDIIRSKSRGEYGDIIADLDIFQRWGECYLVGFNDKQSIVRDSPQLRYPTWTSFGKVMWAAPLRLGKDMYLLQQYNK